MERNAFTRNTSSCKTSSPSLTLDQENHSDVKSLQIETQGIAKLGYLIPV